MSSAPATPAKSPPADSRVRAVLSRYWGFDTLRPLQAEAIQASLDGRDSLVILPTGGGKSLCFQVPPLVTGRLCVVVSPLIALMKDQIDGLKLAGYPAAALYSGVSLEDASAIRRGVTQGEIKLLLVAPERLMGEGFLSFLTRASVGSFAIDEAHCISQWGHDFRPEYRRLAELREVFPGVPFHAYTATATPRVREDIATQLRLHNPAVLVGTFDRPNLTYRILPRLGGDSQVEEALRRHPGEAAIVYCLSRKETERLAAELSDRKIPAKAYHAGMDPKKRHDVQEDFANERVNVVVATVAFGMGIDRSNVRCVVHATMPKSIEHYQQETGRAGRDGLPSECVLLYSGADAQRWKQLMERSAAEADPPPEPEALQAQLELLSHMQRLCTGVRCRHAALSGYFGQAYQPPDGSTGCGACDVCLKELDEVEDSATIALKIVSCVARLSIGVGERGPSGFGAVHIADVLRGSRSERLSQRGHDKLSVYGLLAHTEKTDLVGMIHQLADSGFLGRTEGQYPVVVPGPRARSLLKGEVKASLFRPRTPETAAPARGARTSSDTPLSQQERVLFDVLRSLRRGIATELNVPPYVVFADTTLEDLCRVRPSSLDSFGNVRGVGAKKLTQFGERFVRAIVDHCRASGLATDATPPVMARTSSHSKPRGGAGSAADPKRSISSLSPEKQTAFKMFDRGASIGDVVDATGRAKSTVAGYLEDFIVRARPSSIAPWVDHALYARIASAADELGTQTLRPIYESFGGTKEKAGEADYGQIRAVLTHRAQGAAGPPERPTSAS